MEEKTRETLLSLRKALEEDPRLLALKAADEELSASNEVALLSAKAKEAIEKYAYDKDHFGDSSEMTKKSQHEAYLAKKALDEHPLSREYQKKYTPVRELYDSIDWLLLSPYRQKPICKKGGK